MTFVVSLEPGMVMLEGGVPDVDGLVTDEITVDGVAYMQRHYLARAPGYSLRLHHLLVDDAGRDLHDHPWNYTTMLLTGGYREHTPDDAVEYWAPCILSRRAEQLHRLELLDGPMWTYVVTGRVRRRWGFQTEHGWVAEADYHDADDYVERRS